MLPRHPLFQHALLHSVRAGTVFDPESLVLSFDKHALDNFVWQGPLPAQLPPVPLVYDDSMITLLHEGIHWRQLNGTTLGAFRSWLKHALETDTFEKLRALPPTRRAALLRARLAGRPVLAVNKDGLPDPPIVLARPADPVEILRCTFFDNFLLGNLFTDSRAIIRPHASFEEIFASVIADAATGLSRYHPSWSRLSYDSIQAAYRLIDEVGRLQVRDPFTAELIELTTDDILEAGAVINELLVGAFTREQKFFSADPQDEGKVLSIWSSRPEDVPDPDRFRQNAAWYLRSGHGIAVREFFVQTRLDSDLIYPWVNAAAVCDFALNPPLPPISGPPASPLRWSDIYPPLRFVQAAHAAKRLNPLPDRPTSSEIGAYQQALADATGLSSVPRSHPLDGGDLPDFQVIKQNGLEDTLVGSSFTYYSFLLWCQVQLWRTRRKDLRLIVAPGVLVPELMWTDRQALSQLMSGLAFAPPLLTDETGALLHARGSSERLGTWLASSVLLCGTARDLILGQGTIDDMGMPAAILESPDIKELIHLSLVAICGHDPYVDDARSAG